MEEIKIGSHWKWKENKNIQGEITVCGINSLGNIVYKYADGTQKHKIRVLFISDFEKIIKN